MPDHKHYKLYKPYGYISQLLSNDARQARKKKFLSALYDFPEGIMAVGRLDEKTEGLLFMTTDGKLSNTINKSGVEKEYYAQVDGVITDEAITLLIQGVEIGVDGTKYITKPCKAKKLPNKPDCIGDGIRIRDDRHGPTSWVSITIKEGKFRQVRKMTSAVGFPTLRLARIRIGSQTLLGLEPSQVIEIKELL